MKITKKSNFTHIILVICMLLGTQRTYTINFTSLKSWLGFHKTSLAKKSFSFKKLFLGGVIGAFSIVALHLLSKKIFGKNNQQPDNPPKPSNIHNKTPNKKPDLQITFHNNKNKKKITPNNQKPKIKSKSEKQQEKMNQLLYKYCQKKQLKKIKNTIERYANTKIKNSTFLHYIAQNPYTYSRPRLNSTVQIEIAKLLLSNNKTSIETKDKDNLTPLHYACMGTNNFKIIELLLKNGAKINVKDSFGNTPLIYACNISYPESRILKLLVKHGANINVKNKIHKSALSSLCVRWHKEKIKLLIKYGANINDTFIKVSNLSNLLAFSCYQLDFIFVGYLLENGADANYKIKQEEEEEEEEEEEYTTPLASLLRRFQEKPFLLKKKNAKWKNIILNLLQHGLNLDFELKKNPEIKELIDVNVINKHEKIKELIEKIKKEDINITKKNILELSEFINDKDTPAYDKQTALLHLFAIYDKSKTLIMPKENLLKLLHQIPFNTRIINNPKFKTMLEYIAHNDIEDSFGRSTLYAAAMYAQDHNIVLHMLVKTYNNLAYCNQLEYERKQKLKQNIKKTLEYIHKRKRKLYITLQNAGIVWRDLKNNSLINTKKIKTNLNLINKLKTNNLAKSKINRDYAKILKKYENLQMHKLDISKNKKYPEPALVSNKLEFAGTDTFKRKK